jgi:hypothetical protein
LKSERFIPVLFDVTAREPDSFDSGCWRGVLGLASEARPEARALRGFGQWKEGHLLAPWPP